MFRLVTLGVVLASLSTGCALDGSAPAHNMDQRLIATVPPEQVLSAGTAILQRQLGRVQVDRTALRVTGGPQEFVTQGNTGLARDLVKGRATMRRTATFLVVAGGQGTIARLRIDVDRRDTARQAVMQPRSNWGDTPGTESPMGSDPGASANDAPVWTHVRRDLTLERALLDELQGQFAEPTAGAGSATRPAEPEPAAPPPPARH